MPRTIVTNARKTPRQERSREMVAAILDATARILVKHGYARMTTNSVAEKAGISVGSLYQYFPSRDALVAAVARRHSEKVKIALEDLLAETKTDDLETGLTRMVRGIAEIHAADPVLSRILASEVPRLGPMDWRNDIANRGFGIARAVLASHTTELRAGLDHNVTAFIMAKSTEAIMTSLTERGRPTNAGAVEASLVRMLFLLLKEPSRVRA